MDLNKRNNHIFKKAIGSVLLVLIITLVFVVIFGPTLGNKLYATTKKVPLPFDEQSTAEATAQEQAMIDLNKDADGYFTQGKYKNAAEKYNLLIKSDTTEAIVFTSLYQIAESFYQTKDFVNSIKYYEKFITEKSNENPAQIRTAYERLVEMHIKQGNMQKAKEIITKFKDTYEDPEELAKLSKMV